MKVLDFGIAISLRSSELQALTAAGSLIGSTTHMSPGQVRGEKATAHVNIYLPGVTLYELIAGDLPLNGATTYRLMMAHRNTVPVPLHAPRADILMWLSNAIAWALKLSIIFALAINLIDAAVSFIVVRPLRTISASADRISQGQPCATRMGWAIASAEPVARSRVRQVRLAGRVAEVLDDVGPPFGPPVPIM